MKQQFFRNALLLLATVGIAVAPTKAFAHQVQTNYFLNAWPEAQSPTAQSPTVQNGVARQGESLELQSTFSNGQPLKGAKVSVYAPNQPFHPHSTGMTDSQGRFSFNPDKAIAGEWEVKIKRDGHSDILYVPVTGEGIDSEAIASAPVEEIQDVHYASSPLMAVGSIAVAAACIGFARTNGGRKAK